MMTLTMMLTRAAMMIDYGDNDNHLNTEQDQNDQWSMNMLFVELSG